MKKGDKTNKLKKIGKMKLNKKKELKLGTFPFYLKISTLRIEILILSLNAI